MGKMKKIREDVAKTTGMIKKGSKLDKRLTKECKVIEFGGGGIGAIALILAITQKGLGWESVLIGLAVLLGTATVLILFFGIYNIFIR